MGTSSETYNQLNPNFNELYCRIPSNHIAVLAATKSGNHLVFERYETLMREFVKKFWGIVDRGDE
jgi:hypothetical protein